MFSYESDAVAKVSVTATNTLSAKQPRQRDRLFFHVDLARFKTNRQISGYQRAAETRGGHVRLRIERSIAA